MNLKIWGCLGMERPRTELNDSKDDVVRIFNPATESGVVSFYKNEQGMIENDLNNPSLFTKN